MDYYIFDFYSRKTEISVYVKINEIWYLYLLMQY